MMSASSSFDEFPTLVMANTSGIDTAKLQRCMKNTEVDAIIRKNYAPRGGGLHSLRTIVAEARAVKR